MAEPLTTDLIAPTRRVPFIRFFSFLGQDFAGSTALLMQVRAVKDTLGTPIFHALLGSNISIPYAGTATVAAHVAAGRLAGTGADNIYTFVNPATGVNYMDSDSLLLSQIRIGLDEGHLNAVPPPEVVGDDWTGWYDIIRTPAVGDPELTMRGKFIAQAAVTIP